ncbi:MAG: AAA family ATPase [Anaeromyxobacteraceae bacterium]
MRRPCSALSKIMRHTRRRVGGASVALDTDPIRAAEERYAQNLFIATGLRRLENNTLSTLEDATLAQGWAGEVTCERCGEDELDRQHLRRHLRAWLRKHRAPGRVAPPGAPVRQNLRFVAKLLGLSRDEAAVLQFLLVLQRSERLQAVAHALGDLTLSEAFKAVAAATRLSEHRVATCFGAASRLTQAGLVSVDSDDSYRLAMKVRPTERLLDLVFLPSLDRDTFVRAFVEPATGSTLSRSDFADGASVQMACDLVRAAARTGARGVNLLVHGPTGVGKTELARLLGQETGLQVLAVGRADASGGSADPAERLASLRLALQLAPRGQSILLFDELEDLFRWELNLFTASRAAPQMSKQWFGALLEENAVPIVWCTNRIEGIDPAFLRRFAYAVELKAPGARQRAKVLARHLGDAAPLSSADVEAIAQRFEACPAQFATAVRGARLVAPSGVPDRATLERLLAPVHKAITGQDVTLRPVFEPAGYRVDALHCAEDLAAIAEEVARFAPGPGPGLSFCLYGPPGTGKSEYVKYLAWRSGRPLVYRRVSDLVSCYVGQTERNIAAAFEEARQDGSILLFDEADSFLRDRRGAVHSWQVTEVNEFLQQLESFPGIVACTTNLWRDIDEAALRRFVFKLELLFPTAEQSSALFCAFFPEAFEAAGEAAVLAAMRELPSLTPGDFAAVARRVRAVRGSRDLDQLARMLAAEVGVKRQVPRAVGFQG